MAEEKEEIELLRKIANNTRAIAWFIGIIIIFSLIGGCIASRSLTS